LAAEELTTHGKLQSKQREEHRMRRICAESLHGTLREVIADNFY
jgi:hypothetical protein